MYLAATGIPICKLRSLEVGNIYFKEGTLTINGITMPYLTQFADRLSEDVRHHKESSSKKLFNFKGQKAEFNHWHYACSNLKLPKFNLGDIEKYAENELLVQGAKHQNNIFSAHHADPNNQNCKLKQPLGEGAGEPPKKPEGNESYLKQITQESNMETTKMPNNFETCADSGNEDCGLKQLPPEKMVPKEISEIIENSILYPYLTPETLNQLVVSASSTIKDYNKNRPVKGILWSMMDSRTTNENQISS